VFRTRRVVSCIPDPRDIKNGPIPISYSKRLQFVFAQAGRIGRGGGTWVAGSHSNRLSHRHRSQGSTDTPRYHEGVQPPSCNTHPVFINRECNGCCALASVTADCIKERGGCYNHASHASNSSSLTCWSSIDCAIPRMDTSVICFGLISSANSSSISMKVLTA